MKALKTVILLLSALFLSACEPTDHPRAEIEAFKVGEDTLTVDLRTIDSGRLIDFYRVELIKDLETVAVLTQNDGITTHGRNPSITFTDLSPGFYTFRTYAEYEKDGERYSRSLVNELFEIEGEAPTFPSAHIANIIIGLDHVVFDLSMEDPMNMVIETELRFYRDDTHLFSFDEDRIRTDAITRDLGVCDLAPGDYRVKLRVVYGYDDAVYEHILTSRRFILGDHGGTPPEDDPAPCEDDIPSL